MRILEKIKELSSDYFYISEIEQDIKNAQKINIIIKGNDEDKLKLYIETENKKIKIKTVNYVTGYVEDDKKQYELSVLPYIIEKIKNKNENCKYEIIFDSKNKEILKDKFEKFVKEDIEIKEIKRNFLFKK